MRRRDLLALAAGTIALRPWAVRAQQKPLPVVGFLAIAAPAPFAPFVAAFREGLREAGYVEGRNVVLEYRWAEGRGDRLPALAADLVARKVDVITTAGGLLAARIAKEATSSIPVVFEAGTDLVAAGLVASMARPGGNLTGLAIMTSDLNPKRLEFLTEMVPEAATIAFLINPTKATTERVTAEVRNAARVRGVRVEVVAAAGEDEYEPAFSRARAMAGALLVASDPVLFSRRERLVALAARHALPAMYEWREFAEIGGLMSYGTSIAEMHRERGRYVGRVLAGAKPADLPILQPTTFEFVINMKTANALGLTVPQTLFARADEVIE
jgi:putative tryptophan/tyrosine transport system substrate-binding protein